MSVFLEAIDLLEKRGWTQGALIKENGSMCMMGALNVALDPLSKSLPRREYIEEVYKLVGIVREALNDESPIGFNDSPSTTYEDVVLVLKRAHEKLEESQLR